MTAWRLVRLTAQFVYARRPARPGTVTLEYDPGQSGRCDEHGDVIDPPVDPVFLATALGWDGALPVPGPAPPSPKPCCGSTACSRSRNRQAAASTATNPRSDPHSNKHADVAMELPVPLSLPRTGP